MNNVRRTILTISFAVIAASLLVASLKLPLWHMRMEAPQYRDEEALRVNVFAGSMNGDLGEITVLNKYIGVHIPEVLPQSKWLPLTLMLAAGLGIFASLLPRIARRGALLLVSIGLAGAVTCAVAQAKQQMHDIGHKRDAKTTLAGVRDFDPPFLGKAKIAQFTVNSWLGTGAYCIGAAITLQLGAAFVSRRRCNANCRCKHQRSVSTPDSAEVLA